MTLTFEPAGLEGAWIVVSEVREDVRGWFGRTFDASAFAERGLEHEVRQANASFNAAAGTLRGLHFQAAPHGEAKLIRCVSGAVFDVLVDVRPDVGAAWIGVELRAGDGRALYAPPWVAHGFQTLEPGSELHYLMFHEYVPDAPRGVRWDDPAIGIDWPEPPPGGRVISERDLALPLLDA